MLKIAISPAPGFAAGLGVVVFENSDQDVELSHDEPVPSHRMFVADAARSKGDKSPPANPANKMLSKREQRNAWLMIFDSNAEAGRQELSVPPVYLSAVE